MAIDLSGAGQNIEVIASIDPAINVTREVYEEYLDNLDESKLIFEEGIEPTRFVLKKYLDWKEQSEVNASKVVQEGRQAKMNMHYISEHVRRALVDVKNPGEGCKFARDKDGKASKQLVAMLDSVGIVADLFSALQASIQKPLGGDLKKS